MVWTRTRAVDLSREQFTELDAKTDQSKMFELLTPTDLVFRFAQMAFHPIQ